MFDVEEERNCRRDQRRLFRDRTSRRKWQKVLFPMERFYHRFWCSFNAYRHLCGCDFA